MLLSVILSITPIASSRLEGFFGREVQAWFLSQVARHDPALAEELHAGSEHKPYTVSSLIVPEAGRRESNGEMWLVPGNDCLLRFTSLSEKLSITLLEKVLPNLPRRLRLRNIEFHVLGLAQDNAWWDQSSFSQFAQLEPDGLPASVTLEFASPTAFRTGSLDRPLPTPDQVWRSLWQRWNRCAPEALQIDTLWPEFAAACIVVSDFQLRSMKVSFKQGERGAATGCTGQVTYRLLAERHCGELAPFRPGAEKVLHTLARFALYSGVGHHTTTGLGQTRCLHP